MRRIRTNTYIAVKIKLKTNKIYFGPLSEAQHVESDVLIFGLTWFKSNPVWLGLMFQI